MRTLLVSLGLLLSSASWMGCSSDESSDPENGENTSPNGESSEGALDPPRITKGDSAHLIFTWVDDSGDFHITKTLDEIPEARREHVRVQDPSKPPPPSAKVWVADLREPSKGGYKVRLTARELFDASAKRVVQKQAPSGEPAPPVPRGGQENAEQQQVVMYVTSTCPVCRTARRWLTSQNISFVERNIQSDQAAAQELQTKARQQGVSARGVPVFEIGGRLIAGFDRQTITRALGRND